MAVHSDLQARMIFEVGGVLPDDGGVCVVQDVFVEPIMKSCAMRPVRFLVLLAFDETGRQSGSGQHFRVVQYEYGHLQYPCIRTNDFVFIASSIYCYIAIMEIDE